MIAALTLVAVAACGGGDKGDTATADSLSRDLQLAPVDTTAELNDRPTAEHRLRRRSRHPARSPAGQPRPAGLTPAPQRATAGGSGAGPASSALWPPAPRHARPTKAEIRSNKNKVGDTVTATVANDVKDNAGRVVIPAGSEVVAAR